MFAVTNAINYLSESTDTDVENVALDTVDLFDLFSSLYLFRSFDKDDLHVFVLPDE